MWLLASNWGWRRSSLQVPFCHSISPGLPCLGGHYTYPDTTLTFVPTWAGGMFEGLMANEVIPETSWGRRSFGRNDLRTAQVQIKYATEELHYPVWGLSPSSTADDTGNYGGFGIEGQLFPYFGFGADTTTPNEGCRSVMVVQPRMWLPRIHPSWRWMCFQGRHSTTSSRSYRDIPGSMVRMDFSTPLIRPRGRLDIASWSSTSP